MPKVVMGIGLPGSGKSTVLKRFAEKYNYQYVCPDDIREQLTGDAANQDVNQQVWDLARERTAIALREGATVVFDATFAKPEYRKQFLKFAREHGAGRIQGIFFDPPYEVAQARNLGRERQVPEYAMRSMEKNLTQFPPELTDGLDALFILDKDLELKRVRMAGKEGSVERILSRS